MNKQLKVLSRTIFAMFLVLFVAVTLIQVFQANDLQAHPLNQRTTKNAFKVERGAILVQGTPVASSQPTSDTFKFQRGYADGPMFAPVTGYFSHYQGMTGIESSMNNELSGVGGTQFFTRFMRILTGEEPQGSAVELTLNASAQEAAFEAMQGYEGAVVAIEPSSGRILALVSTPSFDPNDLASNDNREIIQNYSKLESDPTKPLVNRAIAGNLYHPGSTYKLLTAAAALESGAAKPDTEFANDAQFTLPGSTAVMQNYGLERCGTGDKASLELAIVLSCNVPIAELAVSMPEDEIPKMANAFGFDQEISIPLIATPSTAPIPINKAEAALSAIGQLDVRATPLQMAMVSAGIANNGVVMQPQLIQRVIAPDLKVEQSFAEVEFSNPISEKTSGQLTDMMAKGVNSAEGAAANAAIEGITVAGKTGTAENGDDETGEPLPYTIWFTGFAPAENPKIAVAVVVANGGGEAHDFVGTSYDIPTAIGKQVMEAVLNQ